MGDYKTDYVNLRLLRRESWAGAQKYSNGRMMNTYEMKQLETANRRHGSFDNSVIVQSR